MTDQATQLRKLMHRSAAELAVPGSIAPRLVALSGGKSGVGTTTLSVNLAISLAQQGCRVVLLDADLVRAAVAAQCGLAERHTLADVLGARKTIHEILERGPGGFQVAPGDLSPPKDSTWSEAAYTRLLAQVRNLGRHADLVLADAGSGPSPLAARLWSAADEVLLVVSPDAAAIMDGYATFKSLSPTDASGALVSLIVNQTPEAASAADVYERFRQSCHRFLGREIALLGSIPFDQPTTTNRRAIPWLLASPSGPAASAVEQLAAVLGTRIPQRRVA